MTWKSENGSGFTAVMSQKSREHWLDQGIFRPLLDLTIMRGLLQPFFQVDNCMTFPEVMNRI